MIWKDRVKHSATLKSKQVLLERQSSPGGEGQHIEGNKLHRVKAIRSLSCLGFYLSPSLLPPSARFLLWWRVLQFNITWAVGDKWCLYLFWLSNDRHTFFMLWFSFHKELSPYIRQHQNAAGNWLFLKVSVLFLDINYTEAKENLIIFTYFPHGSIDTF